jgi:hypothetical protein
LKSWLKARATTDEEWKAYYAYIVLQIDQFQDDPAEYKEDALMEAPPGMPIGSDEENYFRN